jgi:hypothetical protein
MLQDPFLNNAAPANNAGLSQTTAMPWLTGTAPLPRPGKRLAPAPRQMDAACSLETGTLRAGDDD